MHSMTQNTAADAPVDYRTDPSRYRHWRLSVDGVDLSQRLLDRQRVEKELSEQLTPRELEILRLVALKLENQEIASRLSITVGTVKIHLHHVFDKLHVNGRHELLQLLRDKRYWG